jgi:hypothetical protein
MHAGERSEKNMLIDSERTEPNKHTKLRIYLPIVAVLALAVILILCCTGHDIVASEIARWLRL